MKRSLTAVFLALLSLCLVPPLLLAGTPVELTILHMNDTHGHLLPFVEKNLSADRPVSGAAHYAALIEAERALNPDGTLLLSGGDMFQGTPISNLFRGKPMLEVMNRLDFDAMVLGNHEFDWGQETLREMIAQATFPFLSANVVDKDLSFFPDTRPYVFVTRKDITVGIIGVTTPETRVTTKPSHVENLQFLDPSQVLSSMVEGVKQQGAHLVVVLSHLGLDADMELAAKVPGIDVIVGGHSHTAVTAPVRVGRTLVVQAGYYGIYVGVLKLLVDPDSHEIVGSSQENVLRTVYAVPAAPLDEAVSKMVNTYNDKVKDEFSRKVGETLVDLVRKPYEESNFGNVICDAFLEASGAGIALQNGGGIRADILKGPITMEGVYTALPFDNLLVTMDLKGQRILDLLEKSAAMEHRILQVAGIMVVHDMQRPVGSRVKEVFVKGGMEAGVRNGGGVEEPAEAGELARGNSPPPGYLPLDPEKSYRVVTNDFLLAGGDGFDAFKEGANLVYGDTPRDAFLNFLRKHSPIKPSLENRLVFLNP
ncbi:MAG: bifunctional metallophosphatase/5'-nucleotidase [Deltaproteobacteria bacterium]|nr:bifunctional metallophosphatase/5'-nucleotidase [Deltaproteobacteria bacterium]